MLKRFFMPVVDLRLHLLIVANVVLAALFVVLCIGLTVTFANVRADTLAATHIQSQVCQIAADRARRQATTSLRLARIYAAAYQADHSVVHRAEAQVYAEESRHVQSPSRFCK